MICKRCKKDAKYVNKKIGSEREYYAKNMCKSCYNLTVRNIEKHIGYLRKWREANPDYHKNYYIKHKSQKLNAPLMERVALP